jgi:hypothetical protein
VTHLTQAQLAIELGLSDRHVRRWKDAPRVGEGRTAVYDLGNYCAWMVRTGKTAPKLEAVLARLAGGSATAPPTTSSPAAVPPPKAAAAPTVLPSEAAATPLAVQAEDTESDEGVDQDQEDDAPPAGAAELGLGVMSRRRSWAAAQLALQSVEARLKARELKPTPQHAESLARTARMLTEAVRGDGEVRVELSPREVLTRALARWLKQWGEPGLEQMLAEARALVAAPAAAAED